MIGSAANGFRSCSARWDDCALQCLLIAGRQDLDAMGELRTFSIKAGENAGRHKRQNSNLRQRAGNGLLTVLLTVWVTPTAGRVEGFPTSGTSPRSLLWSMFPQVGQFPAEHVKDEKACGQQDSQLYQDFFQFAYRVFYEFPRHSISPPRPVLHTFYFYVFDLLAPGTGGSLPR